MAAKPKDPGRFIDNPYAPEVFADEAVGFFLHNGNVTITFSSSRVDHSVSSGPVNRVVIARAVLPVKGVQSLALSLFDFLKKANLDPTQAATSGNTMQ
jgi:hypothetical protein